MFTKNKKYSFKKFLIGGVMALSVFSTSFLTANLQNLNFNEVYASYQEILSSISNSDFSSVGTSTTPYTPNSWSYNNPLNNESIKNGVINTYETVFQEKKKDYELSSNPGRPEGDPTSGENDPLYKHLMINSYAGFSRAGYSSQSFTLNANSFYTIDVTVKTVNNAKASIYLSGLSDSDVESSISNLTTNGWETYTLLIETNEFISETATLELWLGGKEENNTSSDAVLFNKVVLKQYSKNTFNGIFNNSDVSKSKIISLKNNYYIDNAISNANFNLESGDSNAITGWKLIESADDELIQQFKIINTESYNAEVDTVKGIKNPETNQMSDDTKVLYVNNIKDSKFGIESTSFTLPQSELYKLTIWTKSDCGVGAGATLKLTEVNPDESNTEFTANTASITCATSISTSAPTSNWTMQTFFLEGHPLKNTDVKLQIWLGETEATTGYVFVDDIRLEKVNYKVFENAQSAGATKYTFNTNNTGFTIKNGNFNETQKPEVDLTYPLTPTSWTLSSTDSNFDISQTVSGVVNTNDDKFSILKSELAQQGVYISNPGLTPSQQISGATTENSTNNILLIGNPVETSQTYKSESFAMSASSYYKLSFYANSQFAIPVNDNGDYGISVKISGTNYTLFNKTNINTRSDWEKYTIYFKTGTIEQGTCNIELSLNNIQGFAFFDDVKLETSTEEEFNIDAINNNYKVDLSSDNFVLTDINSNNAFNKIYNWTGTNNSETENVSFGAIDTNKDLSLVLPGISNPGTMGGNNVILIKSAEDAFYTASQIDKYNVNENEFYKISVSVKTIGINQTENNHAYDKDNKIIDYGVTIALNGFSDKFTAINTEKNEENDYVTYTFYISPESSTTTFLELSLGNTNNLCSGYAFFSNVKFETIDEPTYKQAQTDDKDNDTVLILNKIVTENNDSNTGNEFKGSEFDWVIVPSLLLALAIIIALVGTTVRQFKFTKKPKIKTSYDRRKTVEVDLDKREQIELRNKIIEELNQEYNEIDNEINDLINVFKQDEEKLIKAQEQKRLEHEKIKQAILVEKENAIKEYNTKLGSLENISETDKIKFEKQFNDFIAKLDKRAKKEDRIAEEKDKTFELLKAKHEAKVSKLTAKQQFIKEEIARIEREIEAISKQEEIMWNEYRRAKEEAKKQKLEYLSEKRKAKQAKKLNDDSAENVENAVDEVKTEANETSNNDIEIIEPENSLEDDKK